MNTPPRSRSLASRSICRAWAAFAALTILVGAFAFAAEDPDSESKAEKCRELLEGVSAGVKRDHPEANPLARIDALRAELHQDPSLVGTVVYAFVSGPSGVSVLRYESAAGGQVSEEVVVKSATSTKDFRQMVAGARQPGSYFARALPEDFPLAGEVRDQGKQVFLMDINRLEFVPEALNFPSAPVIASPSLRIALTNLSRLTSVPPASSRYAALFGLPNTPHEYEAVFGKRSGATTSFPPLEKWQPHYRRQQDMIDEHDLKVMKPRGSTDVEAKKDLLRQLEDESGFVMIVAHASGTEIRVAGRGTIKITPQDIAALHFKNSPFVFLRVCQGEDIGFAEAFLKAGASGVWGNRGLVDAGVANQQAVVFLSQLRAGKSIVEAIKAVHDTDPSASHSNVLFTDLRNQQISRGASE